MNKKQAMSRCMAYRNFCGMVIIIAIIYGTYGILSNYIAALCERLGTGVSQVVFLFSVSSAASFIACLLLPAMLNRVSAKVISIVGSALYIIFFLCMNFATTPTLLYIGAALFGLATNFAGFSVFQPLLMQWFAKGAASKLSYMTIAASAGSIILSPVVAGLLKAVGFTGTIMINGVVLGVVMLLCSAVLLTDVPSRYGLQPYGYEETEEEAQSTTQTELPGATMGQALRNPACWAVFLAVALAAFGANGFLNNQSTVYQSMGVTAATAATFISVYNIAAVIWTFIYGKVADAAGPVKTNILFAALAAAVYVLSCILAGKGMAVVAFSALLVGVTKYNTMAGTVSLNVSFGPKALGALAPFSMAASAVGTMFGAPVAGKIYDFTGSYSMFLLVAGIGFAISAFLLSLAGKKRY